MSISLRRSTVTVLRASLKVVAILAVPVLGLSAQPGPESDPVLRPGDALRIQVWRMPELSGEFDIDAAGRLLHPLYGSVTVTGVPLSVTHGRLGSILNQQLAGAQFSLQPMLRVAVEGEVRQPNVGRHPPETTIAQAITLAGGMTEQARTERVRLVRGDAVTTLDLRDPANAGHRIRIQSGDRIIVGRRGPPLREYLFPAVSVLGTAASIVNLIRNY